MKLLALSTVALVAVVLAIAVGCRPPPAEPPHPHTTKLGFDGGIGPIVSEQLPLEHVPQSCTTPLATGDTNLAGVFNAGFARELVVGADGGTVVAQMTGDTAPVSYTGLPSGALLKGQWTLSRRLTRARLHRPSSRDTDEAIRGGMKLSLVLIVSAALCALGCSVKETLDAGAGHHYGMVNAPVLNPSWGGSASSSRRWGAADLLHRLGERGRHVQRRDEYRPLGFPRRSAPGTSSTITSGVWRV